MPQPTSSDVHVDAPLTNISVAYIQDTDRFIARDVFPVVQVEKQSDKFFTYDKGDWFRDQAELRESGTESAGSGYGLSTDTYFCDVYAFHKDLGEQEFANADDPINLRQEATQFVTRELLMRQEKEWNSTFFTTGTWDTDVTGGTDFTQWDDYANSDPIQDVETGKETVLSNTGFEANTLVMGYSVFRQLKHHPDIIDRTKYTSSESIDTAVLSEVFGVEDIQVALTVENTAEEGATDSMGFVHGKNALLMHVASNPGLLTPSAGYTFTWTDVSDGLGENIGITRIDMPELRAERVEGQISFDEKAISTDLGYFFSAAVS